MIRRILAAIGRPAWAVCRAVTRTVAVAAAVLVQAARPATWRRAVRQEFARALVQAGLNNLGPTMVLGALIGLGLVYQAVYWLQVAGQPELVGRIIVLVLVREIAPILVGLTVVGCSGSAAAIEISRLAEEGQVRALDAMGIDPFLYLLLPRAMALALATFALSVFFVLAALGAGYVAGTLAGVVSASVGEFLANVSQAMQPSDYLLVPVKTLGIGLAVAVVSCTSGLSLAGRARPQDLLPRVFIRGTLAVLATTGAISALA